MNRNVCDWVMMHIPLQEDGNAPPLSSDVLAHMDSCPKCKKLIETKIALRHLINTTRMDPLSERRLQVKVLSRKQEPRRSNRPILTPVSVALTAAFALVLTISVLVSFRQTEPARTVGAVASADIRTTVPTANIDAETVLKVLKATAENKTVVLSQGASLWMKKGTSVEVLNDTSRLAKARIRTGRVVVDIARHPPGFRFVVQTPSADVEALGTVFSVDVSSDGRETIRVAESAVLVRTKADGESTVVREGEQLVLGLSSASQADEVELSNDMCAVRGLCPDTQDVIAALAPESDVQAQIARPDILETENSLTKRAADAIDNGRLEEAERILKHASGQDDEFMRLLFKLGGAYRSLRDYNRAVSVYEYLVSTYPNRDAAINTLVSIAQIKQGFLKDPAGAIFYFDKYLRKRPRGILSEAAGAGKVRALFSLRQWQDVLESSDAYLSDFPTGISREEILQKRKRAEKQLEIPL